MSKFSKSFEKLLFFITLFLFVFIPLYPKFPLVNVKGTFVAIRVEDFLIALSLAIWGIYILFSGQLRSFFKDRLNQAILTFFFIGLVSSFCAFFVTHTVDKSLVLFNYLRRIELIMLLPLAFSSVRTKKRLLILVATMSVVVLIVNLYAIGQQYLGWKVISTTNSEFSKGQILVLTPGGRVNSTFAGQYDLAIFLVMVLSVLAAVFFYFRSKALRLWQTILAASSAFVLVLTAARLSFVAAVVGVVGSLLMIGKKKTVLLIFLIVILALAYPSQLRKRLLDTLTINILQGGQRYVDVKAPQGVNISTVPALKASDSASKSASVSAKLSPDIAPGEPIDTTQLGVYRSFEIRFHVEWPRAITAFEKNPLLGTGYSSIGVATDNDILRSFGEVGLLGTLSFVLLITILLKRLIAMTKNTDRTVRFLSVGVLMSILAFLLNTIFIDAFEASKIAAIFWLLSGAVLGVGGNHEES